jgi:signal transduction histidine kinase
MRELLQLTQSLTLTNLDLLSVGITIAAIALLGFIVYISNPKSVTGISFLLFCAVTMLWSFFNYISYQTTDPDLVLMLWKIVIFLAFWHSFTFFNFLYVFPREKMFFPVWYKYVLMPYMIVLSCWTLFGGLVFAGVSLNISGVPRPIPQKGILIFLITVSALIIASFVFLIQKIMRTRKEERKMYNTILTGALLTFALLFTFNLILPAVFENIGFIPLGAVTIFPFAAFTAYAIFKHKAFRVTNLGSTLMAFGLCVATFVEIIFAENYGQLILRSGIFLFVLLISIQFVKNIFSLEHITESLEEANRQLTSLDKLKSEFISLASHQLRSPLTVIKGYASTLSDGVVGEMNEKQSEIVRHIYTSAQGLASVVEDFLNVTKIEQGGMQYIFEPTDIKKIVEDLVSDMKIVAEDKHLTFSSDINDTEMYMVNADSVKLKQVFLNLIDNSIKYTKEGFVKVSLIRDTGNKTVTFSVADSGIGLSEETKRKMFLKFSRGEGASVNGGGSGLGLYLAQEIVKAHQGTIGATSEGLGKGATFFVTLPYLH